MAVLRLLLMHFGKVLFNNIFHSWFIGIMNIHYMPLNTQGYLDYYLNTFLMGLANLDVQNIGNKMEF